jgi:hypothetical protein
MHVLRIDRVSTLAERMRAVAAASPPRTYPLFLGAGFARAAGVPSTAAMARMTLESLESSDCARVLGLLPTWPDASDEQLTAAFAAYLAEHTPVERYKVLESFYRSVPIPQFYRDLADLVLAGYITDVLTTNVDTLLEQALDDAGMQRGHDYTVAVVGSSREPTPAARSPQKVKLQVVKLYGDIGQSVLPVGADSIEAALQEGRKLFKNQMAYDLVVVGHDLSDPPQPIDSWLARRSGGELWWVHPSPERDRVEALARDTDVVLIQGEERATPDAFFGRLSLHLIRLPALDAADALQGRPEAALSEDELETELAKGQLLKSRAVTYDLQAQGIPGVDDPQLGTQFAYEQSLQANLAAKLRSAYRPPPGLLTEAARVLDRIAVEASQAVPHVKPSAVSFLDSQARAVADEIAAPNPDPGVVAGAVAAADTLCRTSLGDAISPGTTAAIASVAYKLGEAEL